MELSMYDIMGWLIYFLAIFFVIPVNVFVLVPRYLLKNRPVGYFVRVILLICLAISLLGIVQINKLPITQMEERFGELAFKLNFVSSFISMGLMITGSSSILMFRHWIKSNKRISELESATLQSEMDLLKNQINPHFLLNMLNNANVLIWKDKEEAQRVLYKLENLLRYQLNETYKERVLLLFDIRFLNDFLNLEKIRRDRFEFTITKEGEMDDLLVPSFLFIPFVENAVKHNPDSNHLSYIHLHFQVIGNRLNFYCENSKPLVKPVQKKTGGLGLKNIRRRLALLYPDKHTLTICDEEKKYIVKLKLIL